MSRGTDKLIKSVKRFADSQYKYISTHYGQQIIDILDFPIKVVLSPFTIAFDIAGSAQRGFGVPEFITKLSYYASVFAIATLGTYDIALELGKKVICQSLTVYHVQGIGKGALSSQNIQPEKHIVHSMKDPSIAAFWLIAFPQIMGVFEFDDDIKKKIWWQYKESMRYDQLRDVVAKRKPGWEYLQEDLELPLTASSWSEEDLKNPYKFYEMAVLLNAQREK